jgi:DNA-binding transcriptional MerR regulator
LRPDESPRYRRPARRSVAADPARRGDVGLRRARSAIRGAGAARPAARSEGSYRLYDDDDLERLRFIKGLRDDAGFSLAEIGQLLEDEAARARNRERFRSTNDPDERTAIVEDAFVRVDRQIAILRDKIGRLEAMVTEAEGRRAHLEAHLEEIRSGTSPASLAHAPAGGEGRR